MADQLFLSVIDKVPARPPRAAQLRAIRARARASESVINLLAELGFGPRLDDDWSASIPKVFGNGHAQACEAR